MDRTKYVARYVVETFKDTAKRELVERCLRLEGREFVEEEEMAVVIVDITGYTAITSALVELLGKASSEAVSELVGEYMKDICGVVLTYGELALSQTFMDIIPSSFFNANKIPLSGILGQLKLWPLSRGEGFDLDVDPKGESHAPRLPELESYTDQFINKSLLHRLKGKEREFLSGPLNPTRTVEELSGFEKEYRFVSVLFLKMNDGAVSGGNAMEDNVRTTSSMLMQCWLSKLLKLLRKYEGVLQQCSVDDKGKTILICFGLPPFTGSQPAVTAVRVALEFLRGLHTGEQEKVSLAITSGAILLCIIGCGLRKEAGLLGDAVNLAARILDVDREHGMIAIDTATMETVRAKVKCKTLGQFKNELLQLKGKAGSVAVWGVNSTDSESGEIGQLATESRKIALVRIEEWTRLKDGIEAWLFGKQDRYIAFVEGESGLGKSILMMKAQSEFRLRFDYIWCLVFANLPAAEHTPLRRQKSSSTFCTHASSSVKILSRLEAVLQFCQEPIAHATLIREEILFAAAKDEGNTHQREERKVILKAVVIRVVTFILQNFSCLLLMDDAQWIDPASVDIISAIICDARKSCSIIFSRPVKQQNQLAELPFQLKLVLEGLKLNDIKVYLAASILGQYFSLEDIAFLLDGQDPSSVAEKIKTSDIYRFFGHDEDREDALYFRHITIKISVYESLALSERQKLHLKMAHRLEAILDSQEQKNLADMAVMCHHYWESSDLEKMIKCNAELGFYLADQGHAIEASQYLRKVVKFLDAYKQNDNQENIPAFMKQFLSKAYQARLLSRLAFESRYPSTVEVMKSCALRALELCNVDYGRGKTAIVVIGTTVLDMHSAQLGLICFTPRVSLRTRERYFD
ncbi:hypothetical protein HDU96_005954 [Phlyctochytrium bullatum]|nr:hypothetical protein HDU96_005954 [Phlyctochytrium bullatum]